MAVNQVFNGVTYPIPTSGDLKWGPPLSRYLVALGSFALAPSGGTFTLAADVNFGPTFGLLSPYYKSTSANIAASGVLRLANSDVVAFRNFANSADLLLSVNSSNALLFNGVPIGATATLTQNHILVGNASNQPTDVPMSGDVGIVASGATTIQSGAITDSKVNAAAAIALTKLASTTAYYWHVANGSGVLTPLAVTPVSAVATDSNGLPVASSTTATELGYVHGVTSSIQNQINGIASAPTGMVAMFGATSAPSGWHLCDGSAISRTTFSALFAVIGTNYGPGDGSTTFNVPNYQNMVPVGYGGSIAASPGASSGATTHTLTTAEIPASLTVTDPGHSHNVGHAVALAVAAGGNGPFDQVDGTNTFATTTSTTGISVGGGGGAHSIVQPSLGIAFIIKT